MRLIHYKVINSATGKAVYINADERKCRAYVQGLTDKGNYCIVYKWISI